MLITSPLSVPHDALAVTALRRIAFLLELAQESHRVRAFGCSVMEAKRRIGGFSAAASG
jgi:hypothetical protein